MNKLKEIGGLCPTLFNLIEIWKSNSTRASGRFNFIFFWMYPIIAIVLLPVTLMALIEWIFSKDC